MANLAPNREFAPRDHHKATQPAGGWASRLEQEALSRAFGGLVAEYSQPINERRIFCRLTSIKRDRYGRRGHTLRGWRDRNRLYLRGTDGQLYPVPQGHGTSNMIKLMENGRLFLLTNGIY